MTEAQVLPVVRIESTADVSLERIMKIPVHISEMLNNHHTETESSRISVYVNLGQLATNYKITFNLVTGTHAYKYEITLGNQLKFVEEV